MSTNSNTIQIENQTGKYQARTDYPNFPPQYVPNVVEIHDEIGLLVKIETMKVIVENDRDDDFAPQLVCWYFDGTKAENLAYAHTEHKVLINRISELYALSDITETLQSGAAS